MFKVVWLMIGVCFIPKTILCPPTQVFAPHCFDRDVIWARCPEWLHVRNYKIWEGASEATRKKDASFRY